MWRFVWSLLVTVLLAASAAAQVETWQLDPAHSAAQFSVRHMGISTIRGTFTKVSGTVQYDAASVDSRVEMRDNDLRSPKFLDVEKFPTITFKSKRVESAGAGKLKVTGDLTIHGVTKEAVLDVDGPSQPIKDMQGNPRMGASATTTIKRADFGVSTYPAAVVGDDVAITIDVEMAKPKN